MGTAPTRCQSDIQNRVCGNTREQPGPARRRSRPSCPVGRARRSVDALLDGDTSHVREHRPRQPQVLACPWSEQLGVDASRPQHDVREIVLHQVAALLLGCHQRAVYSAVMASLATRTCYLRDSHALSDVVREPRVIRRREHEPLGRRDSGPRPCRADPRLRRGWHQVPARRAPRGEPTLRPQREPDLGISRTRDRAVLSGENTVTVWPSASRHCAVRRNVVTTPLTWGNHASVTIASFNRRSSETIGGADCCRRIL